MQTYHKHAQNSKLYKQIDFKSKTGSTHEATIDIRHAQTSKNDKQRYFHNENTELLFLTLSDVTAPHNR